LGKLSIGKIVGKMPIIHLFGKAFNSQNCRGNPNYPFVWKSFQLAKIVGKMPFSICLAKSSIGKLKGTCHPPHKLYPCDTLQEFYFVKAY
jgi:hypothetical protein